MPTRGDVDLEPILARLPFADVVVWDNSVERDLGVLGRYAAMELAANDTVATQDDDCLVPFDRLLEAYEGGILVNVPADEKPLLGWGSIVDRNLAWQALDRYLDRYPNDDVFRRCCDVVVTALNDWERVDFGHQDLPWADGPDRMYRRPDHYAEREEVERRCRTL